MLSSPAPAQQEEPTTNPLQKMKGHTHVVQGILRLPGGRQIITCSWDGSLRVWDLESGTQVGEAWEDGQSLAVNGMALSPDGKKIASGSSDGAVRLWDIDTGKIVKKWTEHPMQALCVCWSPDGGRVVSGYFDGTFRVWDVERGEIILGPIETGETPISTICYSPDGTTVATSGLTGLKVWDANTGELLTRLLGAVCLMWTSDGKTLIATSNGTEIRKFDTATWTEIAVLAGHEAVVDGISLSPNERILASTSYDHTARLWNFKTNQPIGPPLHHGHIVRCAAFSVDGKFLTTGCFDHHIYTWDVSAIVRDAGLDDLLSDNESLLNADATPLKPRNYHARRKHAASSSRLPNTSPSKLSAVTGSAGAMGTMLRADITARQASWWTRFLLWVTCASVEYTDNN